MHCEASATTKMTARAPALRTRDSKHKSRHRGTKSEGSQVLMWRYKWIPNWNVGTHSMLLTIIEWYVHRLRNEWSFEYILDQGRVLNVLLDCLVIPICQL